MAFGTGSSGVISRNTNGTVNIADKLSEIGTVEEMTAYGATSEVTTESYIDAASYNNGATNDQSGTSVTTASSLVESNVEYARQSVTVRTAGDATTTT